MENKKMSPLLKNTLRIGGIIAGVASGAWVLGLVSEDYFASVVAIQWEENMYGFDRREIQELEKVSSLSTQHYERTQKIKDLQKQKLSYTISDKKKKELNRQLNQLQQDQIYNHGERVKKFNSLHEQLKKKLDIGANRSVLLKNGYTIGPEDQKILERENTETTSKKGLELLLSNVLTKRQTRLARLMGSKESTYFFGNYTKKVEQEYEQLYQAEKSLVKPTSSLRKVEEEEPLLTPSPKTKAETEYYVPHTAESTLSKVGKAVRKRTKSSSAQEIELARPQVQVEPVARQPQGYEILNKEANTIYENIQERRFANIFPEEVKQFLTKENWQADGVDGSHFWYRKNGNRVVVPHHPGQPLKRGTCRSIFKRIGVL